MNGHPHLHTLLPVPQIQDQSLRYTSEGVWDERERIKDNKEWSKFRAGFMLIKNSLLQSFAMIM